MPKFGSRQDAKKAVDDQARQPGRNTGCADYEEGGELHNISGVRDSDGSMSYHEGKVNPDGTVGS